MKTKLIAIGSVLSVASILSVVACGTTTQSNSSAQVQFKDAAQVATNDTLTAASGSTFSATNTSYENAGNENTTTRAGLRVRKSAVISAIENNLGLNSENKVLDMDKFLAAINKLLPDSSALKKEDFTNLDTVEITLGADSTKTKLFDDIVPSSKKSPIITQMVNIVLHAKDGTTIGTQKVSNLRLHGMQKIRLTDYRRVDITTLEAATNTPTLLLSTTLKPTTATLTSIAEALNKHFDITSAKFATPFFPIWNEQDGENNHTPLFGSPVKHSLSSQQVDDLLKLYKGKDAARPHGDFPRPRVERAVQKVWFSVPTTATGSTTVTPDSSNIYTVTLNLNMDFIKHWSWGTSAYSDFVKTFTLPVQFKVNFGGPAITGTN